MNAIQTGVLIAVLVPFALAFVAELIRIFKD